MDKTLGGALGEEGMTCMWKGMNHWGAEDKNVPSSDFKMAPDDPHLLIFMLLCSPLLQWRGLICVANRRRQR